MPRPRRLGSSSSLNRSLSRLSSSTSFSSRQSNSRIYLFLIAGGLLLFSSVAFLQIYLLRAPQGSKLSPLENGKSDESIGAEQAWWKEDTSVRNSVNLDVRTNKVRAGDKDKVGRKMGIGEGEEGENSDEDMEVEEEMGDEGDEDEDVDQDRFDIDLDDRVLEDETEDLDDTHLEVLAEMSNEDSAERDTDEIDTRRKSGHTAVDNPVSSAAINRGIERVASVKSPDGTLVNMEKGISVFKDKDEGNRGGHDSKRDDKTAKASAIPDWVLDSNLDNRQRGRVDIFEEGSQRDPVKDLEKKKRSFLWDHTVGVRKKPSVGTEGTKDLTGIFKPGENVTSKHPVAAGDDGAAKVAVLQLMGFKEVVQNWKERFNSDDELIDDNVQQRLEGVREIEDALLLNGDGTPDHKPIPSKKFGVILKKGRGAFDPMNPANNPMLQDPDTTPGTWMTKSDKQMLRAMRGYHLRSRGQQPKVLLRGSVSEIVTTAVSEVDTQALAVNVLSGSKEEKGGNSEAVPAEMRDLRDSGKINSAGEDVGEGRNRIAESSHSNATVSVFDTPAIESKSLETSSQSKGDDKQWVSHAGIKSSQSSSMIETFLGQESCSLNVFMAWTTSAWGFTARHERVLESLFRFHRNACVVIFSESFELDHFKSFIKEGYKVIVVRPNLHELLADTPSDAFAAILPKWREKPLFYLHYTELLRLAALYKFGGVYLDMDVIVLRALDSLHNTVGTELTSNGELRLNGAILVFDKSSLYLKKCMEEFTNTYNETLIQWNGADLLTRVANSTVLENGSTWRQFPDLLNVQGPFSFFPLDSSRISKFFAAPEDSIQKQRQMKLLTRIYEEAYTVHLWNSLTSNLVPEINSLVEIILSRSCLRCKDAV